jgi:sulfate adenylyltransferase
LLLSPAQSRLAHEQASDLPSVVLRVHELAALELLMQGALTPLNGFNTQADATRASLPLVIPATPSLDLTIGAQLALRDHEGVTLAVLHLEQIERDADSIALGGPLRGLQLPVRELFTQFHISAASLRDELASGGKEFSVCVHARGDIERQEMARISAEGANSHVVLRILDGGNPDTAHQVKRTLSHAQRLREQLGSDRCVVVVSPDPSPIQNRTQQALDECYARNIGCSSSIWLSDARTRANDAAHGACIFFTGLSGAGKSTLARSLHAHVVHSTERAVTLLDGDVARQHLSKGLGFSRADRDLNVQRIGYVASRIVMHGGLVLCAPIAPYTTTRAAVRSMVEQYGRFIEVHVSTSLAVCEARDRKGLYAKARAGDIKEFTGISDPYELPVNAEFTIDTDVTSVNEAVLQIATALVEQ